MTSPPNPSASQDAARSPPFVIHPPRGAPSALVLDSPHSGCHFPADFGAAISIAQLRNAEDPFVDTLFARAPDHGASLIAARFPRSYIDPNRAEGDIDLALIEGEWPDRYQPSGKAHLGKSLIWRSLDDGTAIYRTRLSVATVRQRIANYLLPYQRALGRLIDETHAAHGRVYHLNCHSMDAVGGAMGEGGVGRRRADVVLGDRDGTTCAPAFTAQVADFLRAQGYSVAINDPFKGVELVRRFSAPARQRHSLQIELNKRLYLHDGTRIRSAGCARLQTQLGELMAELARTSAAA